MNEFHCKQIKSDNISDHKPSNTEENSRICKAGGWVEYNRVNGNLALSRGKLFRMHNGMVLHYLCIPTKTYNVFCVPYIALGDFVFKRNTNMKPEEQMVIALPDVETRSINEDWEFVVLACDGIWDVLTNEEVVEFVRRRIGLGLEPEAICEGKKYYFIFFHYLYLIFLYYHSYIIRNDEYLSSTGLSNGRSW